VPPEEGQCFLPVHRRMWGVGSEKDGGEEEI
jgi:hypothetical protein